MERNRMSSISELLETAELVLSFLKKDISSIFSLGNTKLIHCGNTYRLRVASFDLPAGYTCPMASLCHSRSIPQLDGTSIMADYGEFRCYASSTENLWKNVRNVRWSNLKLSTSDNFVARMNAEIISKGLTSIRIHSSGDFYNHQYLMKWIEIARMNPAVEFWGYTKQATFIKILNAEPNIHFVYSVGGLLDGYAKANNLPSCYVVTKVEQAFELGVEISCTPEHKSNDYEYIMSGKSFALLIHGTQKAGIKTRIVKSF
jgi:hypothetical protein